MSLGKPSVKNSTTATSGRSEMNPLPSLLLASVAGAMTHLPKPGRSLKAYNGNLAGAKARSCISFV